MLRLKTNLEQLKFSWLICRNYLSHEYKNTINGFDISTPKASNGQSEITNSRGIISLEIVNGFVHDDNRNKVFESFLKLRSLPEKASAFESTNFAIFKNFFDNENIDEIVSVIKNRLETGFFVDNFIACFLLDYFLQEAKVLHATELGVEIYKQETLENTLVTTLILKSFFEYLKKNIEVISAPAKKEEKRTEKSDEIKVRVKFIRNVEPTTLNKEIGKAMVRIAELHKNDVTTNFKLLGSLLNEKYDLAITMLNDKNIKFFKDTLEYSQALIKNEEHIDKKLAAALQTLLEQITYPTRLDNELTAFLEDTRKREEAQIITEQKKKYEIWREDDIIERKKIVNVVTPSERKESIEKILTNLTETRQKLWYFENEEQIDLEIFKKTQTYYPKKWFGKKKKPRAADENYVPPEISRKMV
ncbi:uncharacterized protein [Eurosta solidaginis]|uniref:uncharacterized protein n=1 Tax=Eurosta solidaginis TaxID=178769 RepID=UPI00353082DD